jgi:hypothetical protein
MRDRSLKRFHDFHVPSGLAEERLLLLPRAAGRILTGYLYRETALGLSLLAVALAGTAGCKVQVDKSSNGEGDNVKIATPFGGISVNKDQTTAAELGLPAYPGSMLDTAGDGNRSAKVDLGFGSWKLRVKVANYSTADNRDQVLAFYRKALSEYGGVIECAGDKTVGLPVKTGEGLSCDHSDHDHSSLHGNFASGDLPVLPATNTSLPCTGAAPRRPTSA